MSYHKRVLCVDDDQDDLNFLFTTFRDLAPEVQVVHAVNGIEALNLLETSEELPSLIVLDLNMPFMNGKETLQRIREHYELKNLPVVIYTAGNNPNDTEYFKKQGISMVSKPYSNQRLKQIVNDFLTYL